MSRDPKRRRPLIGPALSPTWADPATWGPWRGVPPDRQKICAVLGCTNEGKPHRCPFDGELHHHGCVHYDCTIAPPPSVTGLEFRQGWGWLCPECYGIIVEAFKAMQEGH